MKVKFLGTSYGAPCENRHQQSILIEAGEDLYIFDTGAPVLDILIRDGYDPSRIKAIFISHIHGDHLNGIFDLLNLSNYFNMNFTLYISEQRGIDFLESYCKLQGCALDGRVRMCLIGEGDFYSDSALSVSAFKTAHMSGGRVPSFAFLIENRGKSVCITGDLSPSLEDLPELLLCERTELIVSECAHFSAEALFEKLKLCNTGAVAIVHVMPCEKYSQLKAIAESSGLNVCFPDDGDEICIVKGV